MHFCFEQNGVANLTRPRRSLPCAHAWKRGNPYTSAPLAPQGLSGGPREYMRCFVTLVTHMSFLSDKKNVLVTLHFYM